MAIFWPTSTYGLPKSNLVIQIYCTFSLEWTTNNLHNVLSQTKWPTNFDPYSTTGVKVKVFFLFKMHLSFGCIYHSEDFPTAL